jgi:hypothetical protein
MIEEDDSNGWHELESARIRLKQEKSFIRKLGKFLLEHGIVKNGCLVQTEHILRHSNVKLMREAKSMKAFGFNSGFFHSFDGPAIYDIALHNDRIMSGELYYIYGLEYTKSEWSAKVKKRKIAMIRKGK